MTGGTGETPDLTPLIWLAVLLVAGWIGWKVFERSQRKKAEARVRRTLAQDPNSAGITILDTTPYRWTFQVPQHIYMMGDDQLVKRLCWVVDTPQAGWTPDQTYVQRRGHLVDLVKHSDSD